MLAAADAALVIGDPALYFGGETGRLDLGEEWAARTGLPFVFAFWAGPPGGGDARRSNGCNRPCARAGPR